jgi:hypothetical protein
LYSTSYSGSATDYNFAKASKVGGATATGEYAVYTPQPGTLAGFLSSASANKWYQALDLEIINSLKETLYTGISTKDSTNTLRLNIGPQILAAESHAVHFFSFFDIIIEFDYANQMINVIQ